MNKIVNVLGISLNYQSKNGEIEAISHIDLDIAEGEFVSIVGPSGCGKSTLLSIISGLLSPSSGSVYINGKQISGPDPIIGFMPQRDHLFSWRTVFGNIMLGLEIQHRKTPENVAYAEELLRIYGLSDFREKYPSQLSGGMRQRVALIRTLTTKPELLLLDEPFSSLDYQTRLAVSNDIYHIIKQEKKTAIMVTHDISEAICVSDRIVVLSRRPAHIKAIHAIDFDMQKNSPMARREHPLFRTYFNQIWRELDVNG